MIVQLRCVESGQQVEKAFLGMSVVWGFGGLCLGTLQLCKTLLLVLLVSSTTFLFLNVQTV